MTSQPVIALVGATAVGKSGLSLDLAERMGGEIVNTDSMQVYRGMDIGTAKVPTSERRGIPHHLLDIMDIHQAASVAEFQGLARERLNEVSSRGKVPILVGGSALYTRAVLDAFEFPGTDPQIRSRLEEELGRIGSAALHARLVELDPEAARGILSANGRRIVRALEVIELTGRRFSSSLPAHTYAVEGAVQIGLDISRSDLDPRIERRVAQMFADGLVEEVRGLAERGLAATRTASRAIGYRETLSLIAGELTEEQARTQTCVATRRFSRRQDGWFRKDPRVIWLPWNAPDLLDRAMRATEEQLSH